MSEIERLKAEIAMLQEILPLEEELEAARAVKDQDPERWFNAKQAYEPIRTYWREIDEYIKATSVHVDTPATETSGEAISPVKGDN